MKTFFANLVICVSILWPVHTYAASIDKYDKDGFLIELAGTGGNCVGCEWINIDGVIPADAGEQLEAWAKRNSLESANYDVSLNSDGGNLVGGMRLGRSIRKLRYSTTIAKTIYDPVQYPGSVIKAQRKIKGGCFSACAYAFLGGVERIAEASSYGVHQFYSKEFFNSPSTNMFSAVDLSNQQVLTGIVLAYVIEMGADPKIAVAASNTAPGDMFKPDDGQLADWRIRYSPMQYTGWHIKAHRDGIISYAQTQSKSEQVTITCDRSAMRLIIYHHGSGRGLDISIENFFKTNPITLFDKEKQASDIGLYRTKSGILVDIPINNDDINNIQNYKFSTGGLLAGDKGPRYWVDFLPDNIPVKDLSRHIRLVRKNCASPGRLDANYGNIILDYSDAFIPNEYGSDKTIVGSVRAINDYNQRIAEAIHQRMLVSRPTGNIGGKTTVSFIVNRGGYVTSAKIIASSGVNEVDNAAISIFRQGQKFDAIPPAINQDNMSFTVPLQYRLN